MALTAEEFLRVVTPLRERSDLYPAFGSSLTADELSSMLFNRRGQDGQGHTSNDQLGDLHLAICIVWRRECNECMKNDRGERDGLRLFFSIRHFSRSLYFRNPEIFAPDLSHGMDSS